MVMRAMKGMKGSNQVALANALKKIDSMKRQFMVESARADHFAARLLEEKKLRNASLTKKHRVVHEYTGRVTQVQHEKNMKSAKAAFQEVIGKIKRVKELNNSMHQSLVYWKANKKYLERRRRR